MCIGGPGAGVGAGDPGLGTAGNLAGSNVGNFAGIGPPPGTTGPIPQGMDPMTFSETLAGMPPGTNMGVNGGNSDIAAFNLGKTVLSTIASLALGLSSLPVTGPLSGVAMMANAARGAGQPPGDVGPAMAAGANPGGIGGSGVDMTLGSLTGITNPMLQPEQPVGSEPRPVAMPVGDITSSLFSVPPPKVNVGNLMASRGVRGAGTKTALPEWFNQGKRGY